MKKIKSVISTAILSSMAISTNVSASDQELLDTLFENKVLNKAQYEKLSKQQAEKQQAANSTVNMSPTMAKALDWASRVKISGDMRFRHENIDLDDTNGVKESRQRIRARLKVAAKINEEVDVGFRLVTTGGKTSTNQTIENSFSGKDIFFDRAYINWHPEFSKGVTATFGKFKQPWYNVSSAGLIWDSDVNPEGVALTYATTVGSVNLAASGGYFILEDGDTIQGKADNNGFSDDLNMYHTGVSASMNFNEMITASIGSNAYIYNKEATIAVKTGDSLEDSSMELYEIASKINIDTGFLPVYVYAQYVVNAAAIDDDKDTAWLAGFGTKYGPFKLDYNFRDTQEFAVADTFNDSDFAAGTTAARGHKVKLGYKISKNFAAGFAYFAAQEYDGTNVDTLQVDLKAKF